MTKLDARAQGVKCGKDLARKVCVNVLQARADKEARSAKTYAELCTTYINEGRWRDAERCARTALTYATAARTLYESVSKLPA